MTHGWRAGAVGDVEEVAEEEAKPRAADSSPAVMSW